VSAVCSLGRIGPSPSVSAALAGALADPDEAVRAEAAKGLKPGRRH
jgi:hypothetical protein